MDFSIYEQAMDYIRKAKESLPEDHRDREYFDKFIENMPKAKEVCDSNEKRLILSDTAIKVANQLSFILFREKLLSPELEADYRKLPDTIYVQTLLDDVASARQKEVDKKRQAILEAQNEQKSIDIFIQVMSGKSVEDAEAEYQKYVEAGGR